jgi:hypothetical protein
MLTPRRVYYQLAIKYVQKFTATLVRLFQKLKRIRIVLVTDHPEFVLSIYKEKDNLCTDCSLNQEKTHAVCLLTNDRLLHLDCTQVICTERDWLRTREPLLILPVLDALLNKLLHTFIIDL